VSVCVWGYQSCTGLQDCSGAGFALKGGAVMIVPAMSGVGAGTRQRESPTIQPLHTDAAQLLVSAD
jgi:hypothetical protein